MASTDDLEHPFTIGDGPRLASPPKTVVGIAAVAIVAMAGIGLARGIMLSRPASPDAASPLAVLAGLSPAATAAAKPATILPRDDSWSTLSGPRMLDASEKPKPEPKVAASDDADDSASPAEQTAATDAIAPDAPDAAPAAPAASSNAVPAAQTPPPSPAGPPPT